MTEPNLNPQLPAIYMSFNQWLTFFCQRVFVLMFAGGCLAMLLANMVFGPSGWELAYHLSVAPAIIIWLIGNGTNIMWYTWLMRKAIESRQSMGSFTQLMMLMTGVLFLSGGMMFLFFLISTIIP